MSSRGAADHAAGGHLSQLATEMRIGTTVRIERLRPSWAAGWVEDLTLDSGGIGELLEHLQEEYGGKKYRCTVLLPNGAPGFEATIDVAGPPMADGSEVDRDEWNGQPGKRAKESRDAARERNHVPAAATSPHPPTMLGELMPLITLMVESNNKSNDRQIGAVRELVEKSAAQNQGLIQAIVEGRTAEKQGGSLAGQLNELAESKRAIDKIGKMFGAAAPAGGAPDDDDMISGAVKEAGKSFVQSVIASEMGGMFGQQKPQQPRPVQNAPPRSVQRPVQGSHVRPNPRSPIPDALRGAGHNGRSARN